MDTKIHSILSREILDSRGNPTIETTVILTSGYRGTASVPSGASVGKYEAVELRDGDEARFGGLGVTKAVANVTGPIAAKLRGMDASNQKALDDAMNTLDGTPNKANLGANSILSVSLSCAIAAATSQNIPLYRYINAIFSALHPVKLERIPTPLFNVINGGKHGAGNLDFQEFFLIPATGKRYHEGLQMGTELYHSLKKILAYRNAVHSVGDEGGFAPNLYTNMDAMEVLMEAIRATRYRFGVEVFFGLDVAATHFKTTRGYQIKDRASALSSREFINYLKDLHNKYRLLVLEDPIEEDDWGSWAAVTREIGNDVMIVGDDLLVTNKERLERAIAEKACNAILLKPNQIGTLTEFLQVVATAKKHDIKCIVSHRSGETSDATIADIAVAVQSEYVKFGAPARGERVAKYNRLLQIETELSLAKA
ncbi:phosphopyruvate hydratase [Candidatus Gottesmanbacteria bacterium RIFCSPLOWO2_01_FULL_48_11]|uniref:Enolase n=2 Tax=Candidatus Gottesmaniibacteriota TaxID=1752720 RepID=A0A1F6AV06_9BACT|nr:MAG: phosphopyruvate hydratase [Candidatus Gottesmanbacteria bacterium RIFCSPLOWO2_01_FULL_48_11]